MADQDVAITSDPPCRVLARSKTKVELFVVSERGGNDDDRTSSNNKPQLPRILHEGPTSWQQYAPDGSCVYLQTAKGVIKVDLTESFKSGDSANKTPFLQSTTSAAIQMMHVSPSGSYLLTWQRPTPEDANNLKLWSATDGSLLACWPQKQLRRDSWPTLQWTYDEQFAMLLVVPNEIRVYSQASLLGDAATSDHDPSSIRFADKIRVANITSMSLPTHAKPGTAYYLTTFVPGTKDKPARGGFYEYIPNQPNLTARLSKSLFQAEEMKSHWSPQGDAALITLATSVDHSGQSYYGSSQLFLMADFLTDAVAVEGVTPPIMAVEWMPNPDKTPPCFAIVAGKMPALASLHHGRTGKPTFLFGQAHRNSIQWSPHGRFVLLGGFGNLAGGMSFWDRNKCKLVAGCAANVNGHLKTEAVVGCHWSPDSRMVLTSTTSPRMNVDNGMRLFKYNGSELNVQVPWDNQKYRPDQLLEATFVPAKLEVYPDRPQSPNLVEQEQQQPVGGANTKPDGPVKLVAAPSSAAATSNPVARYVPPSARGRTGGSSLAERLRREKEGALQQATKIDAKKPSLTTVKSALTGKPIPGLAADQGKSASALKREKQKLKKQQEDAKKKQQEMMEQQQREQQVEMHELDPEKKARKINKTLKQIDELKAKDPSTLNDDQKAKIASEASLREELKTLSK